MTTTGSNRIAELRALVGIDPDAKPTPPTAEETAAWLADQAAERLERVTPPIFRQPITLVPELQAWVGSFAIAPGRAPSLLLAGQTGVGKTHQAWQALRDGVCGAYRNGYRPYSWAVKHPQFNRETRPQDDNGHEKALDRYSEADVLLFDDLGSGQTREWGVEMLHQLVDYRVENELPTIWTTNLDEASLRQRLGDRILSRIWLAEPVILRGVDRRRGVAS